MKVQEIMTEKVQSCLPNDKVSAIARMMRAQNCGFIPVVTNNNVPVGVITDRDVCMAVATKLQNAADIEVRELMSRQIFACFAEDDVNVALRRMKETKVRRLPVLNHDGKLIGILSLDDIVLSTTGDGKGDLPVEDVFGTYKSICAPFTAKKSRLRQRPKALLAQ
jgi:CBS domain-containing protein